MSNVYLLIYEPTGVERETLLDALSGRADIVDWHAGVPSNMVAVVTDQPANLLRDSLKGTAGLNQFMLIRADPDRYNGEIAGWLPKATWEFITAYGASDVLAEPTSVTN